MNTEEKAKAYDEVLERANKQRSDYQKELDKADKNSQLAGLLRAGISAIDMVLPELAESDDERIRKALVWHLKADVDFVSNGVTKAECIAYLEKQKEHLFIPDKFSGLKSLMLQYLQSAANRKDDTEIESDTDLWGRKILDYVRKYSDEQKEQKPHYTKRNALFDKCVENCDPKTVEEVNKRVDDIMNMPELSPFEQALTNFIGDWEDDEEHWPSQFVKKHGKHILNMAREELQKEQKPSVEAVLTKAGLKPYKDGNQWCILAGDNIQEGICGFGDTIEDALYEFLIDVLNTQKEQKPLTTEETELNSIAFLEQMGYTCIPPRKEQKPAELGEEDESELQNAIDALEFLGKKGVYKSESGYDAALQAASWLKSLPLNLKKKNEDIAKLCSNEWSKEDEKMYKMLSSMIHGTFVVETQETQDKLLSWLKSFRPQYHGDVTMTEAYKMGKEAGEASHWELNEEDKQYFDDLIARIEKSRSTNRCYVYSDDVDWLKSKLNGNSCK